VTALDNLFAWNQLVGDRQFRAIAQIEQTTSLPIYLAAGLTSLDELAASEHPRVVVDSPASGFGIALVAILESIGISPDRIEIVGAGGVNERLTALVTGEGDIALLAPFVAGAAEDAGLRRVNAVEEAYPSYPGLVIAALEVRADDIHPELTAYLAALAAGRAWLADQPDAAMQALVAMGLDEPAARTQLALCGAGPMTVSRDGFALLRALRASRGLLPEIACEYDDLVTNRFLPIENRPIVNRPIENRREN
jgi:ABC-type nitrate/sulfonate/bicarbonate transport system substrate-binding protein